MNEYYIVYDSQLDKFVKIKKLKEEELVKCIESYATFLTGKDVGISDYIKKLIVEFIPHHKTYDIDECAESLFECIVEVYPGLQIEFVCKHLNESLDENANAPVVVKTLKQINAIKARITKKLIGQDDALEKCLNAIKLVSSGLEKYISLFFIGPTGVGKTELARLLASEYLGSNKKLLKINCGEYSNSHEYAKLVGSPPGYIGHNEKGILTEKASQSSEWIICFDEIEKAHDKLIDLLLNLLDEGKITDSHGTELDFEKSIFVFTSNVGLKGNLGRKQVGFDATEVSYEEAKSEIQNEFENKFSPEFRNRLDGVIHFNQLNKSDVSIIAKNHLKKLPIKMSKRLVNYVVDNSFSPEFGARNIKRYIKNNITVKVAEKILDGHQLGPWKIAFSKKNELSLEGPDDI
tara:strand:+ start:943 stop:2160 length:1218 start_codon:yes stop_codon:yes gene_type:complete